jgi:hypothetical protein
MNLLFNVGFLYYMPQIMKVDNVAFNVRYSNCEKRIAMVNQFPCSI